MRRFFAGWNHKIKKLNTLTISAVLLVAQLSGFGAMIGASTGVANAATVCVNDQQGANDQPGQKDLTRYCEDTSGATTDTVGWQWDETTWSGNNSGDACILYDTDNDGKINRAVCATINGASSLSAVRVYSCTDSSTDKCTSSSLISNTASSCTVSSQPTQPFVAGAASPNDATTSCNVVLSEVNNGILKDVCSYPSQQPNSDPSDCINLATSKPDGDLEIKKVLSPTTDAGLFNLQLDGNTVISSIGNGGTTGKMGVNEGTYVIGETAVSGVDLNDYVISFSCKDKGGATVPTTSVSASSVSVRVDDNGNDSSVTCTITNTRKTGNIVINKNVVNDNGGTLTSNSFGLTVGGQSVTSGQVVALPAGKPVAINEAGANGYQFVSITGSTACPAQLGGTVTPVYNQTITCTITNDDKPASITVNKVVVNDNGGTKVASDFGFKVNNGNTTTFNQNGTNVLTNLSAGTYNITEPAVSGYSAGYQGCANIQLKNGDSATCTITNNDQQGTLIVKKNLINDNGGNDSFTAFSFKVNGGQSISFNSVGEVGIPVNAGTYSVVENSTNGRYAVSYSNCTNVNVPNGGSATCTITNNDIQPKLTVTKIVVENWNGPLDVDDFPLSVKNTQLNVTTSVTSGVQTGFNAGSYKVSEQNQPGYSAGDWKGDCSTSGNITLQIGREYACTITNYDKPGKLIVKKVLINDNGGTKKKSDFDFTINGGQTYRDFESDGENLIYVAAGIYTVREKETDEYTTTYSSGCNQAMVANDQTVTCTITNNDKPATLIVEKVVINDNGGEKEEDDFSFRVNNGYSRTFESDGSNSITVNAGTYSIEENEDDGYTASYELIGDASTYQSRSQSHQWGWDEDDDDHHDHHDDNECSDIKLKPGETKTCVITNDDKPGKLIIKKVVINDNGGTLKKNDFSFIVDDGEAEQFNYSGQNTVVVDAGWHQVTEVEHEDYSVSYKDCNTYVKNGDTDTCVITNNDKAPKLTVIKCTNQQGLMQAVRYYEDDEEQEQLCRFGSEVAQDFNFEIESNDYTKQFVLDTDTNSQTPQKYTTSYHLQAGSISVTEAESEGWSLEQIRCIGDDEVVYQDNGFSAQMSIGDELTCYFFNEEHAEVVVTKYNDTNEDGEWNEDENVLDGWTINLEGLCEEDWYLEGRVPKNNISQCCEAYDARVSEDAVRDCDEDVYAEQEVTNQDGEVTFSGLKRGGYELSEEMQEGWEQSVGGIDCSYEYEYSFGYQNEENSYYIYPSSGETVYCTIGNHRSPEFTLKKTNDATAPKQRGQTVTYTLTVTIPETSGRIYDSNGTKDDNCEECEFFEAAVVEDEEDYQPVVVVDLPPADFKYVAGSWTATSNVRGDLKAQGITTEPTYASPGTWILTNATSGFLVAGEVVTLTYKAVIGSSVATATHPDSAFAQGFDQDGVSVYANGSLDPFVGTKVSIVDPAKTTGFVLGTSILVDTGRAALVSMLVGIAIVILVAMISRRRNLKLQPKTLALTLSAVTAFVFVAMFSSTTNAASLATIQIPDTTTKTRNFNVGYTIQSTEEAEDFSVKLYVNGVETSSQSTTKSFGDSGQFPVALPNDGVYTFQVKATGSGSEVASSQIVSTTVDTQSPAVPAFEGTVQQGNSYTVRFSVPAGSDAIRANVYAATSKTFMLDSSTRVASIPVTAGTAQSYSYNAPTNDQYYFAVVLEDAAGNTSTSVGDVETAVSSEAASSTSASNAVASDGQVQSDQSTLDGSRVNQPFDQTGQDDEGTKEESSKTALYIVGGVIAAIVAYALYARNRSNTAEAELLSKSSKTSNKKK